MRVHMLQNAQIALNFLKYRKVGHSVLCPLLSPISFPTHSQTILRSLPPFSQIKLVNIRPDDIVDGNQKLTLGLVWTIILHYQVRHSLSSFLSPRAIVCLWMTSDAEVRQMRRERETGSNYERRWKDEG